jgi:predicted HNH restriction endonuclease
VSVTLNSTQIKVRKMLIQVASGHLKTDRARLISYKELWRKISREKWGQARGHQIAGIVFPISVFEIMHNRPPLNELVVTKRKRVSADNWEKTKRGLEKQAKRTVTYHSHDEAKEACWHYWGQEAASKNTDREAEEGYQQDRSVTFRQRNSYLIAERKRKDDHTCQACGFRLEVNRTFIIDCHHGYPLANGQGIRITGIDELMCLCPTCHRISHTRKPNPLNADEICELRGIVRGSKAMVAGSR